MTFPQGRVVGNGGPNHQVAMLCARMRTGTSGFSSKQFAQPVGELLAERHQGLAPVGERAGLRSGPTA